VLDNVDSHNDRVHRVTIRRGVLKTHYTQIEQTTYTFTNKADVEQTVYLDHPRRGKEWKLFETPDPHELTENFWRFKFPLPAKQVTKFTVRERHTLHQSFALADMTDQQFTVWLEACYLDKKTEQVLRQIVELRQEAAALDQQLARLEQERSVIHAEQKRIRENLQALGDRAAEKELRERFVRTLNTQEDRLERIEQEVREKTVERDKYREKINKELAKLDYDAEV
jgi:regulator of replication initiation timing